MKNFKILGSDELIDYAVYVRNYVLKHDDVTVFVGTDSSPKSMKFATVIMLYHQGKGAHLIFKEFRPTDENGKIMVFKDLFSRLFQECLCTYEVTENLNKALEGVVNRKDGLKRVVADLDINPDPNEDSNVAYAATTGFLKGEGYEVRTKPEAYAASCAADWILR